MASMRVHELAKEYGLTSKEMLDKLRELKIPAKSHASVLADAYVGKIRKALGEAVPASDGDQVAERPLTKDEQAAKEREAEEERARREAVEQERARREAERAERTAAMAPQEDESPAEPKPRKVVVETNPFASLENQIESERERAEREAAEARAAARRAAIAKDVAKKQAVEAALRQRTSKRGTTAPVEQAAKKKAPEPVHMEEAEAEEIPFA